MYSRKVTPTVFTEMCSTSFFMEIKMWKGGGGVCAERDVTQEGSRKQT